LARALRSLGLLEAAQRHFDYVITVPWRITVNSKATLPGPHFTANKSQLADSLASHF
jgi:hypothetical protein